MRSTSSLSGARHRTLPCGLTLRSRRSTATAPLPEVLQTYLPRLENLRSELYFLHIYRHWSHTKLSAVRFVRCLEVLFTFGKAHKWADARTYLRKSKILLKKERTK